jgi:hypothetical protein
MMMKKASPGDESLPKIAFEKYLVIITFLRHFNKEIAVDSNYFKSLKSLMTCVEKNAQRDLSPEQ